MTDIAALTPLVVMAIAFCAVAIGVYRFARRESVAEERKPGASRPANTENAHPNTDGDRPAEG